MMIDLFAHKRDVLLVIKLTANGGKKKPCTMRADVRFLFLLTSHKKLCLIVQGVIMSSYLKLLSIFIQFASISNPFQDIPEGQ